MASIIPIGTVIPYAGSAFSDIQFDGWLPCNGTSLSPSDYPDLFKVIGTVHGGDGNQAFNLPNLQGLFVRSVDDGAGRDPDASTRHPAANGGQSGDNVGSLQAYATRVPRTIFKATIDRLPNSWQHGNYGSLIGDYYANWNGDNTDVTVTGGDSETRPVNAYVNFIVKYMSIDDPQTPSIPTGAIVAVAGDAIAAPAGLYLLCDGRQLSTRDRANRNLYQAIGTSHGGNGLPYFNIPDYRGRFFRGVAGTSGYDPDMNSRTAMAAKGNAGNSVGSIQDYATGRPTNNFTASVSNLPNDDHRIDHIAGYDCAMWGDGAWMNLASAGGDKESRPVNAYVDWYIKL
jgi:microcystin-dependent protein